MYRLSAFLLLLTFAFTVQAQRDSAPAIKDYGPIFKIDKSRQPDATLTYKIVIDVSSRSDSPETVNSGLYNLARMMNLHVTGGIPLDNMEVVAAIHGGATFSILDNKGYNKKYGIDNPNLDIIDQLDAAGVKLLVCGQSLMARNNGLKNVNPTVEVALSAMTVMTEYQAKDFGTLKFQ